MTNLQATIDALGELKARIADLEIQEKAIKATLAELDPGAYEGAAYRLTISESVRSQLDLAAVREHCSPQFIRAHTTKTEIRTLRVTARTGLDLAA